MTGPIIRRRGDRLGGLPSRLPPGERILWQDRPDWRVLARRALHVRGLACYLGLMLCWFAVADFRPSNAGRTLAGVLCLAVMGVAALGLLVLFAWLLARSTVYTLTDQRLVLRFGIALSMSVNLPLRLIDSASVRVWPDGTGDIPLAVAGRQKLGYAVLWPHARPWRLGQPEPMLRAVPEAAKVARMLSETLARTAPVAGAGTVVRAPAASTEPVRVPEQVPA